MVALTRGRSATLLSISLVHAVGSAFSTARKPSFLSEVQKTYTAENLLVSEADSILSVRVLLVQSRSLCWLPLLALHSRSITTLFVSGAGCTEAASRAVRRREVCAAAGAAYSSRA